MILWGLSRELDFSPIKGEGNAPCKFRYPGDKTNFKLAMVVSGDESTPNPIAKH